MVKTTKKLQVIQKFLQTSYTGIIFFVSRDKCKCIRIYKVKD